MQSNLNYFEALGISFESASTSLHCTMTSRGLQLLRKYEGCSLVPYKCPAGLWTIGYGHVLKDGLLAENKKEIPNHVAEELLYQDASNSVSAGIRLTPIALNSAQKDAIGCFIFNLGAGAYQRSALRKAIIRGEEDAVQREWIRWVWAGGRKLPGLVKRRAEELALFFA